MNFIQKTIAISAISIFANHTAAIADVKKCSFLGTVTLKAVWNLPEYNNPDDQTDVGDYEMELLSDISYTECAGDIHKVEKGTVVNGASIPRAAWTILGYTPWSGKSQRPAILHDFQCENALFTSDRVHKLFYETLQSEGVSDYKSRLMYAAVANFGPQWTTPGGPIHRPTYREGLLRLIGTLLTENKTVLATTSFGVAPQSDTGTIYYSEDIDWSELSDEAALADIERIGALLRDLSDNQILEFAEKGEVEVKDVVR